MPNKEQNRMATGLAELLTTAGYITEPGLATILALAEEMQRPVLLEGSTGVGKTEVALALATARKRKLIRLQCYEGLDINTAVYEWNYRKQLLALRIMENSNLGRDEQERDIFGKKYLLTRPLLQSISEDDPVVLLIDEVDRADEEFEAYLLELLADFQVTIPELGTISASSKPSVILTSNATRELSDALRRRCLYYYIEYPSFEKELRILKTRIPDFDAKLAEQVVKFVQELRTMDLKRRPGISETLDWAAALACLNISALKPDTTTLIESLSCLLKTKEDLALMGKGEVEALVNSAV